MTHTAATAPPAAEQIRSACLRADGALLAVDDVPPLTTPVHHLLDDGSFAVAVPVGAALAAGAPALLEFTDLAPLPLRKPVRSLVWIRGWLLPVDLAAVPALLDLVAARDPRPALLQVQTPLTPDPRYTLWRLEVASAVVADAAGAESIGLADLMAAEPDPFCALESGWLNHLESDHQDVVARLAARLPTRLRRGTVRPLGLDRYGVSLRVENTDGDHDVRLPFPHPVTDGRALGQAIRLLIGCPFLTGLRPRQG